MEFKNRTKHMMNIALKKDDLKAKESAYMTLHSKKIKESSVDSDNMSKKDKYIFEKLENNIPAWETTKGSNLANFNLDCLNKALFVNTPSKESICYDSQSSCLDNIDCQEVSSLEIPEEREIRGFESAISTKTNFGKGQKEKAFQNNKLQTKSIQGRCDNQNWLHFQIKEDSLEIVSKDEDNQVSMHVEHNTRFFPMNTLRPQQYVKNYCENQDSELDPFEDSGSEYIPTPTSSICSDTENNFSSDTETNTNVQKIENINPNDIGQIKYSDSEVEHQEYSDNEVNNNEEVTVDCGVLEAKTAKGKFNQHGIIKLTTKKSTGALRRDKRENCIFCEQNVTNFARHITRRHKDEPEVAKIISMTRYSKERKYLIEEIRKKGNFLNTFGPKGFVNPVRRPKLEEQRENKDYLPCPKCKGLMLRNYLRRHKKKCHLNFDKDLKNAQAAGLTLLHISGDNHFEDLKKYIFPHMQPDDITEVVMNDYLIKYYGLRYFRCHKEKHLVNTVSQRMREFARFLQFLQNQTGKLDELIKFLKPEFFDNIINATNEMCGYDPQNDTFKSPSLALRWGTAIKQLCETAIFLCQKNNNLDVSKEIKMLKGMIETQFRFYVSTNANKDLTSKKWKKGSMLPLTEDVIKINEFLIKEEEKCYAELKNNINDVSKVRYLTELLLAHVILLNRKRSGEAQRITIEDFLRKEEELGMQDIYESLTLTEKVLIRSIKRFTIRGKKGRSVPVIFTQQMQQVADLLLTARVSVAPGNPYLFANPTTKDSFLWAYKILKKMAFACNVSNINSITATSLRKHIATIAQLISMGNDDLEQLSNHLGHEKATHLNFYRKTDDKLQIAKVSKLLLLMEKKSIGEYRGKKLEDIDLEIPDIDDDEDVEEQCVVKKSKNKIKVSKAGNENTEKAGDENTEYESISTDDKEEDIEDGTKEAENINKRLKINKENEIQVAKNHLCILENVKREVKKIGRVRTLIKWSNEQKNFAVEYFQRHLKLKIPPKKKECEDLKKRYPTIFNNKSWPQIKIFIVNKYKK